jgi:ribosomal protein S18 acetylase RimI-like enzyme
MTSGPVSLRPTIDRPWLDAAARRDPIAHALAVWDLARCPDRVRCVSAIADGTTIGYLLVWLGLPATPIVHWFGDRRSAAALAGALPPRPLVVVVPPPLAPIVARARGPVRAVPLLLLVAAGPAAADLPPDAPGVQRLRGADRARLAAWASVQRDPVAAEYPRLDPESEPVWALCEGDRIRGAIRAAVRLPAVWLLAGVYVEPDARGRGIGLALVRTALAAARRAGAAVALYVREDRPAARAVYARAGFVVGGARTWVDAGAGVAP